MKKIITLLVLLVSCLKTEAIFAQQPYVGEIKLVTYNFVPIGWAECNGQLLDIAEYETLFALIGTTYGGDGVSTFAVPDLRGRIPMGQGTGNGLSQRVIGQTVGSETVSLTTAQLPAHNHSVNAVSTAGNVSNPSGAYFAQTGTLDREYSNSSTNATMNNTTISSTGQGQPVSVVQPVLVSRYIISLFGIFPSQN